MRTIFALGGVILTFLLAACGGGGGGGGGTSPPPPPTSVEPPVPRVTYTGNSNPAIVDKSNAVSIAAQAISTRGVSQVAESLWIDVPQGSISINETQNGPDGGTATIVGEITNGVGYLDVQFNAFSADGLTVSGHYIQRPTTASAGSAGFTFSNAGPGSLEFDDLELTTSAGSIELRGVLAISGGNSEQFDLDLQVTDTATGDAVYYAGTRIDFSDITYRGKAMFGVALSGTVFDSTLGSIELSTPEPLAELQLFEPAGFLIAHGRGRMSISSGGAPLELWSISRTFAALLIDSDSDQVVDQSLRVSWGELAGLTETKNSVAQWPIANAGDDLFGTVGFDMTAHGLFSHDDDGDWLSFNWDLVAKPLTSNVTLSNPSDAAVTIVPDVDGDYLLRLQVTDGQQASETHVRMRVDDVSGAPRGTSTITGALEVARPFTPGVPILVDGYSSANRTYVPGFESWFASGPGNATLTDLGSTYQRELTVDSNGLWEVTFDEATGAAGYLNSFGFVRLAVGPDIFESPLEFIDSLQAVDIIDADYNGDGQTDLVLRVRGLNDQGVQLLTADGDGSFTASPVLDTPDGELAVGDLNGDGRLDIAVSSDDAIYLSYQQTNSTPAAFVPEPIPDIGCTLTDSERDIGIGDIDGDGRDDLITLSACDGELIVWRQNATGGLDVPTVQSLSERARVANFVDVNDDGRMDALLGVWENGAQPVAGVVALAQADGSFVIAERFPAFGSPAPTLTAGDINSDGLTDIVMLDMSNFSVFERQANGTYVETISNFDMGDFVGFEAATKVLDIDGDGDTDIVACKSVRDLYVGYQVTSNNFEFFKVGDCANLFPTLPSGFAVMDFNNDGKLDILSTSEKTTSSPNNRRILFELFLGGTSAYARPVAP